MFAESVLKAFANYPIIEGAVALLILYGGYRLMNKGAKDGPAVEYPHWLTSGPVNDVFGAIYDMRNYYERLLDFEKEERTERRHHRERVLEILRSIERSSNRQAQTLEMIQNENLINPRRLQE